MQSIKNCALDKQKLNLDRYFESIVNETNLKMKKRCSMIKKSKKYIKINFIIVIKIIIYYLRDIYQIIFQY